MELTSIPIFISCTNRTKIILENIGAKTTNYAYYLNKFKK